MPSTIQSEVLEYRKSPKEGNETAAIAVCDITRPAPNAVTLPPLLERLQRGGISKENITIQIATGLHRPATNVEIEEILGQSIAANYRVVNHDAKDFESHAAVGATRGGTPIYIDSRSCVRRSPHYAWLCRAASYGRFFWREEVDRPWARGAGDNQGFTFAAIHARSKGNGRVH